MSDTIDTTAAVRVTTAGNDVRIEVSPDENATPLKVGLEQKGAQ